MKVVVDKIVEHDGKLTIQAAKEVDAIVELEASHIVDDIDSGIDEEGCNLADEVVDTSILDTWSYEVENND